METPRSGISLRNATLVGESANARPGADVLVEGRTIREVAARPVASTSAEVVDLGARTLTPGLIDCHVDVASF
jgi:imidazolonepropionase-like amidohydrolase